MAKLSNVLNMPIDQMSRVGDVINHLSNNIAATAPEIVETDLRAAAMGKSFGLAHNEISALAGTFIALGKSPEIAGTAINMMTSRLKLIPVQTGAAREAFDSLGLSMSEYTAMLESGDGKGALMSVLEALTKITGVKRAQVMKDIFGEQAQRHINSLVEGLDKLKQNFALVSNETEFAGSMQREFAARSATTENNLQLLKNQMAVLAANVGATLLPAINSVVGIFGKAASSLSDFAEKHPTLIKCIGLAVAGLASFKLASFALGYGFIFLKGGVLSIIGIFTQARTAFSLVKLGIGGLLPVIKSVGLAFTANPIGLIITGIAVGATLLIKYWKPISAFFKNLFAPVVAVFKNVWDWISKMWEKAKNIFNGIKSWVSDSWVGKAWNWAFGGNEKSKTNRPPEIGETIAETITGDSPTTNVVQMPVGKVANGNTTAIAVNAPITINASAGMNAEEIATAVNRELTQRETDASRRARSVNYD
jgi:TP901 family phage tail tape measure protein